MAWHSKALVDLCESIFAGGDVPKGRLSKVKNEQYSVPIYANGEKDKGLYGFTDVPRVTAPSMTVSARGTIGYSEIRYEPFLPVVRLIVLTPKTDEISLEFLKYALKGMDFKNSGTSIPQLTVPMIKNYKINLPDLAEQKRIVAILDQVFADIEKARATAETNLKNARELFDSYLQQVFSERGEDWIVTTIDDLVEEKILDKPIDGNHGEIHPKKADFVDSGVPFIMASDIKDGLVDTTNCSFISKQQADSLRKGFAKNDDVLLSHKATIGRAAILQTDLEYVMLTPQVTYYRVLNNEILSNQYVYWYFNNPIFLKEMKEFAGAGSTRAYIGITKQRKLNFSYPNLTQQIEIVSKLNSMVTEIEKLEPVYRKKINALDELRKSILQKAFTGRLAKSKGIAA